MSNELEDRHPSVQEIVQWFQYDHLANNTLKMLSEEIQNLADSMVEKLPDSPELTVGLRKLLEAKDCFVRCGVAELRENSLL